MIGVILDIRETALRLLLRTLQTFLEVGVVQIADE